MRVNFRAVHVVIGVGWVYCSVDGKAMRLMIDCFVGWQSCWEEISHVVRLRPSLDGGKIGCKDNKSGVGIWGVLGRCI